MKKKYFLLLIFEIFFLTGCLSSGYGSRNNIRHTYITDTQRWGHTLSGVKVNFKGNAHNSFMGGISQVLYMTNMRMTYYIDREKVDSFNVASSKYSTFIKLPPGEHEFAYRVTSQGFMTLGLPTDKTFYVYRFSIPKGVISKITVYPSVKNKETRELNIDFDNVSWDKLVGECHSDYFTCNPQ